MAQVPISTVGKYQITDLVGEGAMGNVYRALDPVLNRSVAIKVMSDAIARDVTLRDRFMREAQAAGSLQHPNVVTIFDFGEIDGHLFIAMEFVEGVDLEELIDRHTPISVEERLGIIIDVLQGLSYAHKRGVVHRDIKPANIRITDDGRAKIMDFGVAHLESTKMTATGVMIGTPNYMAPEQVTGGKVGPATDIFAAGAVLYELVSYRKAFAADSLHNVLFKVVSSDPPSLATVAPDAPRALEPVLRKALAKEPDARYQSAQEMVMALTSVRAALSPGTQAASPSLAATIAARTAERLAAAPNGGKWSWTPGRALVASFTAVALVAVTWAYASSRRGTLANTSALPPANQPALSDSVRMVPAAPETRDQSTLSAGSGDRSVDRSQPPPRVDVAPGPDREIAIVNVVRASAMRARARAAEAGVSASQLAVGDVQLAQADRFTRGKRYADAVAAMNGAMTSWADVERTAQKQAASAATSTPQRATVDSTPPRPAPQVSAPVLAAPPPAVSSAPSSTLTPKTERPAPSPVSEITALMSEYARAIESRDLSAIRAIYPSITNDQQRGFERFFATVRGLRATLNVGAPAVDGNAAVANVSGTYEYSDASGRARQDAVAFRATFRRDGGRWRIASVR